MKSIFDEHGVGITDSRDINNYGLQFASAALPEISDSEDPSLPLPQDSRLRVLRIHQGPHQPTLSKYKAAIHRGMLKYIRNSNRGKARSFCSNAKWYEFHDWSEYSPKTDKMHKDI